MEHIIKDFKLILYDNDSLLYTFDIVFVILAIFLQSKVHAGLDADKINYKTGIFTGISSVYTRNCLYDVMLLRKQLINVNSIKKWHIKSCQPHINDYCYLEVRIDILKLNSSFFSWFICTYKVIKVFRIILAPCHNHFHHRHRFKFFIFFLGKNNSLWRLTFLYPFRTKVPNNFIEVVCNIAVSADKHTFSSNCRSFFYSCFIVLNKILCNSLQYIRISNNRLYADGLFFAFFNLVFIGTTL